jgi:hypothetical protein
MSQKVAARDDSGAAEGAGLLVAGGGDGAWVGEEAGVVAKVPAAVVACGGGGSTGPRIM